MAFLPKPPAVSTTSDDSSGLPACPYRSARARLRGETRRGRLAIAVFLFLLVPASAGRATDRACHDAPACLLPEGLRGETLRRPAASTVDEEDR